MRNITKPVVLFLSLALLGGCGGEPPPSAAEVEQQLQEENFVAALRGAAARHASDSAKSLELQQRIVQTFVSTSLTSVQDPARPPSDIHRAATELLDALHPKAELGAEVASLTSSIERLEGKFGVACADPGVKRMLGDVGLVVVEGEAPYEAVIGSEVERGEAMEYTGKNQAGKDYVSGERSIVSVTALFQLRRTADDEVLLVARDSATVTPPKVMAGDKPTQQDLDKQATLRAMKKMLPQAQPQLLQFRQQLQQGK